MPSGADALGVGSLDWINSRGRAAQAYAAGAASMMATIGIGVVAVTTLSVDRVEAVWAVNGEIGESSQVIPIRAAHPDCPSWARLGGLVVTAVETAEAVTLSVTFPSHDDETPCEWLGNAMRATVKLEQPLGDRRLIDGSSGLDPATPAAMAFQTGQAPRK